MATSQREDDPARLLNRRYVASLGAVASLLVLNQLLVQPQILALAIDPSTMNRAGRQRMLSQRLAKAALAVERARPGAGRRRYLDELDEVRAAWAAGHDSLRNALGDRSSSTGPVAAIRASLRDVEPSFARIQGASARLIRAWSRPRSDPALGRAAVDEILEDEGRYLQQMERVVGLYEVQARARVDRLRWTGLALTGLAFVGLAALGLFVLRPTSGIIRRQVAELQRTRDELDEKVRERTGALSRANRDLEEEGKRRTTAEIRHRTALELASHAARINTLGEAASNLAHELNQPLGAIANYIEGCLVELGRDVPDLDGMRAALQKALASTLRAGEVIKRVRRFVTRRGLEREPFDPGLLLSEVAEIMNDDARRRGIELRIDTVSNLPLIWGDPVQIQQVLTNLVRNAFEAIGASETSGKTVVIGAEQIHPDRVQFRVTDDGEGISDDHLRQLFDPYFSTRAEGMGMGLAISRTIVEGHEGTLTVQSQRGVGSTFRFTLPTVGAGHDDESDSLRH